MIHLISPPQEVYGVGFATTNRKIGTQGHRASRGHTEFELKSN